MDDISVLARVLAAVLVVGAIVIIVTSGESVAVRFLVGVVTADVAVRLVVSGGRGLPHKAP